MKHEIFEKKITIDEAGVSFDEIYKKSWFPNEIADEVKKANVLIIPTDYNNDYADVVFPEMTSDFLSYIRQIENGEVVCDIAISDDNFRRTEKHSALIEMAPVIVSSGIVPIVINMISSYLYDLVSRYRRTPEDTSAKVKIFAEETKIKKTVKIEYEGPVCEVKDVMEEAFNSVFK